jgi:hypothetical protein
VSCAPLAKLPVFTKPVIEAACADRNELVAKIAAIANFFINPHMYVMFSNNFDFRKAGLHKN